ncbi:GDP-L-fucose synthase [bacterium]|nr:GDP-L-fucose synthase [bacterium]
MKKSSKIYIAGHRGMVGSAIMRHLIKEGYSNIIIKTRKELNLLDSQAVEDFFKVERPEYVFLAAAKVGGIHANATYPAEFIYENLTIQTNIIHQSYNNDVHKLLFLGSSCIYPKLCPQPIKEEYLLSGNLEPTNEPYAIAKIAGIQMCQSYNRQYGTNFISAMPTNLYGFNDNFHPQNSHVIAALIGRFHEAKVKNNKEITIWGTGTPMREFLYVDDLADACVFLMKEYNEQEHVNVGTGFEISIRDLAEMIREVIKLDISLIFDTKMPDGTPRKVLDVSKINQMGWKAKTSLKDGLGKAYDWYCNSIIEDNLS